MQKTSTAHIDYQQRALEFQPGDLVYPMVNDRVDESQAGRVVHVFPAIGQLDVEFAWGNTRIPVEEVQKVTGIAAIPPQTNSTPGGEPRTAQMAERVALYWAAKNRQYRATPAENDTKRYRCPKCVDDVGEKVVLKKTSYKKEGGGSVHLLACPSCLFLIKPCDIIGHASYEEPCEDTPLLETDQGFDALQGKTANAQDVLKRVESDVDMQMDRVYAQYFADILKQHGIKANFFDKHLYLAQVYFPGTAGHVEVDSAGNIFEKSGNRQIFYRSALSKKEQSAYLKAKAKYLKEIAFNDLYEQQVMDAMESRGYMWNGLQYVKRG